MGFLNRRNPSCFSASPTPPETVITNTLPVTLANRLFTWQRCDSSTGLYYYNARYYDPLTGQFTQPDSMIPDPLNPAAWNRFSYVYGNPVNYSDPSGHIVSLWNIRCRSYY